MRTRLVSEQTLTALVLFGLSGALGAPARADLMIVGNDEKVAFGAEGNRAFVAPGKDTIVIVDLVNTDTGKKLKLPGQPASMRTRNP
jgi:hypothetical protein